MSNNIWEKVETALKRYVRDRFISATAVASSNLYAGHETGLKTIPNTVAECFEGEPEIVGNPTGNWICKATMTLRTKNSDETGLTNSARFGTVMDAFMDDHNNVADNLTSPAEQFTCFLCQITRFTKHIQGDELVCEIGLTLHCCAS